MTPRSSLGRFTFPSSTQSNLLINLGGSQNGTFDAAGTVVENNEVSGWIKSGHFCGAGDVYTLYFTIQFDHPFSDFGSWNGSTMTDGSRQASGGGSGMYVAFDTTSQPVVLAKVGVSFVSVANALQNAQTEDPGWNFDSVRSSTFQSWDTLLKRVQVTGGTSTEQTIFYTALYHSLLHPNSFSDVNGQYIGFDNKLHSVASGHAQYANFSGWDVYRSQEQLLAMVAPSVGSDIATSMLNDYARDGMLPKWALNNGESYVMVGDPADGILADLYAFGATRFNTNSALQDMVAEATKTNNIRPGLDYYENLHFEPDNGQYGCCNWYGSASTTQEYAVADEAIGQFASAIGARSPAQTFLQRAQNWEYVLDPATRLVRPKLLNGQFYVPFVPENFETGMVEGNAYQYTPMAPFNLQALITAMGGSASYQQCLDQLFAPFAGPGAPLGGPSNYVLTQSIFGGMAVPFAWAGNEPSVEIPWEYDFTGAPYKTQDVVRRIVLSIWTNQADGLPGNDDLGEMSAWYVWSALGMYPEITGTAYLALGSPLFTSETIQLPNGKTLTVDAPNASDNNRYIQSVTLNGTSWNDSYLPPTVIQRGGTITEALDSSANTGWAAGPSAAPPSFAQGELPALGFTHPSGVIPPTPGAGFPVSLGAQNVSGQAQVVSWKATASSGITVMPSSGSITLSAGGSNPVVTVTVATPTNNFNGSVTFNLTTASGTTLPPVVDTIGAASACLPSPSAPSTSDGLAPFYNNPGISDDCNNAGDFDQEAYSYSEQALASVGLMPGGHVVWNGFTLTWPSVGAGQPDNVIASGQTIPLSAPSGATTIGFLGSASNGDTSGSAIITYSDGSQLTISLGFSDWTLAAGGESLNYGNAIVGMIHYRNWVLGPQTVNTYIFGAQASLLAGKTPVSITLPASADLGEIHIFTMTMR